MIGKKKSLIAAAVAALGLLAIAGTSYADRGEGDCGFGEHRMHGGPEEHGQRAQMLFEKFDVNGDGTITKAELDETRSSKLKGADGNGDGQLSLEEFQAVWLEMTRPMMVDRFQDMDEDGNGQVTDAEFGGRMMGIFAFLDRNGDGNITKDELRDLHGKHRRHDDEDDGEDRDDD